MYSIPQEHFVHRHLHNVLNTYPPTCVHLTVASVVSPVVIHSSESGQKLVAWGEGQGLYFDLV